MSYASTRHHYNVSKKKKKKGSDVRTQSLPSYSKLEVESILSYLTRVGGMAVRLATAGAGCVVPGYVLIMASSQSHAEKECDVTQRAHSVLCRPCPCGEFCGRGSTLGRQPERGEGKGGRRERDWRGFRA